MAGPHDIRLPPKWIELNITKRECSFFIATSEDDTICQCGRSKIDHADFAKHSRRADSSWNPALHTRSFPTDAFGSVIFEGEHHPNKAHFVRLSYDTSSEVCLQLMTLVWGLPMPQLLITVQGSSTNFHLSDRLGKVLQMGLIRAAKSCNAWIFTSGLNDGVTKHIGMALNYERNSGVKRGSRVVAVGIAPWGLVEHREELIVRNKDTIYNPLEHTQSKFRVLNPKHNNFLLVDNGSVGKVGGENFFRRRLEKCISRHPTGPSQGCGIPVVCIIIEGGIFTLRTIGDYLHDDPPTPVVILAGSGRTADLIAWVLRRAQQLTSIEPNHDIEILREEVYAAMMKVYHVNALQCVVLFAEIRRIIAKQNLVTVYNMHATDETFDSVILGSIFRSQHWSPLQQLSLALVWDRVDIAKSEVFVYGREWSAEHLEVAMMEALVCNRLEFVTLLLEHGVNMQRFLTVARLEALYNTEHSSNSQVLRLLVAELAKLKSSQANNNNNNGNVDNNKLDEMTLTIHDVGVAISHMMGHIYKSNYVHMMSNAMATMSNLGLGYTNDGTGGGISLLHPFDDLFVWAVLTKRHSLALLLWRHGQGALVKALVAVKLNKFIAEELIKKSNPNFATDFLNYAMQWERLSFDLVDICFKQDQKRSRQLLTMELDRWSSMTNLQLAVISNHKILLGHPCCQILLADLWMGALNIKTHQTFKVLFGIFFPFIVCCLEYKSTEELKLLPHQEKQLHSTHSHSHPDEFGDAVSHTSEGGESLRTYDSKSKSTFIANVFHRHQHPPPPHREEIQPPTRNKHLLDVEDSIHVIKQIQEGAHAAHHLAHNEYEHVAVVGHDAVAAANNVVTILDNKPIIMGETTANPNDVSTSIGDDITLFFPKPPPPQHHQQRQRSSFVTTRETLPNWKKFYEFQRAPITNFYRHAFAYIIFVILLSYLILVPQNRKGMMGYVEMYVVAYLVALGLEVIREFLLIDALNYSEKFVEFQSHLWQIADLIGVCFFMIGLGLRLTSSFDYGLLMYRVSSIYWNLRLYKYMGVHRFLGPKIVMMFKMLKHMGYFALIIFVVIIAFGIAREAIRFPDTNPTWRNLVEAFLEPYVMMFGEVDTDSLAPQCGDDADDMVTCPVGYWIIPITWSVYMLVANILIVNVLIAVFNGVYSEVDAMSLEVWLFQRFNFVMEVEGKPLLPPPFMLICHVYEVLIWLYRKTKLCLCEQELETQMDEEDGPRFISGNDHRLKTYLTHADESIVFEFEEDNVAVLNNRLQNNGSLAADDDFSGFQRFDQFMNPDVAKDRQVQQLRANFQELSSELESHRQKLDRILSYWEEELELDSQDADSMLETPSTSKTSRLFSLRKTRTGRMDKN